MKFEFVKANADAIKLDPEMYFKAYQMGMSFSQFLENIDPTPLAGAGSELDAFERQLHRFGIRTKDDPKTGAQASKGELFFQSNQPESRILFPEYLNRVARISAMDESNIINELVAGTETISDAGIYRSLYIDDTQAERTMSRVGERGMFPIVKISWSEKATTLAKYGVAIQMSYEFVRRASLPLISTLVQRIMTQTRLDEVAMAIAALQAGDGSLHASGGAITALTIGDSDLQGGTPGGTEDVTYLGYLKFLYKFYPGACTTIIGKAHDILLLMTMEKPTVDPLWFYTFVNQSQLQGKPILVNGMAPETVRYVISDACTEDYLIAIDKSAALFAYREAGADLTETNKIINGQWNEIVISNTIGFQTLFASARKQLQTND